VRAVLDPNVLVAALLSPTGAPAQIVSGWLAGEFELVVSESLLEELERALGYPKLRDRIPATEASEFIGLLRTTAVVAPDPPVARRRSPDPGDDYLLELAESQGAHLVSGDHHLLGLIDHFPISSARGFLELLP
jgi:putative PIN family toxin of toxin-antitoxin system